MPRIHVSKYGTYHPAPDEPVAWTVNDTRGYTDGGPSCDTCGACECFNENSGKSGPEAHPEDSDDWECVGLSFCYVCLDGGDALCEECNAALPPDEAIVITECDCK